MSNDLIAYAHAGIARPLRMLGSQWTHCVRPLLLLVLCICTKSALAYSFTCTGANVTSPFPARIVNSASQNGSTLASGNLFVTLTGCKNNSIDATTFFRMVVPTDAVGTSLLAAPGITVKFIAPANHSVTTTSGSACSFGSETQSGGLTYLAFNHPVGSTCNFQASFPLSLTMHTANGAIAGTVGTDLTGLTPVSGGHGWALYDGTSNNLLGLSSSLTLVSTTCTLSTSNVTVTLPKISSSALGSAGTTAGRTPFTLALAGCANVGAAYSAKASWAFAEGASGPTTIANSAASPASNVYVQLLDSALLPISNGGSSTLANVVAAGANQTQHYAQYVSGGVVGAGMVQGVATLSLFYE